jgi:hypothetical protein
MSTDITSLAALRALYPEGPIEPQEEVEQRHAPLL